MFDGQYDIVTTNPPFGSKCQFGRSDLHTVKIEEIEEFLKNGFTKVQGEVYFTVLAALRGTVATMLIPDGLLSNDSFRQFRQRILEHFALRTVVSVPADIFHGATAIKTSIMVITSMMPSMSENPDGQVMFALAESMTESETIKLLSSFAKFCDTGDAA